MAISGTRQRILYASKAVAIDGVTKNGVQSATYGFELARTDVNAFGKLGAHDRILTTTPTVTAEVQALAFDGQTLIPDHSTSTAATQYREKMMTNDVNEHVSIVIALQDDENDDADYSITASPQLVRVKGGFISSATAEA